MRKGYCMPYRTILLGCLLFSFSYGQRSTTDSIRQGGGIIFGNNHAFFLTSPGGWVMDNSSGMNQGLYAVFYPKGGGWKTSPAVMYAYTVSKESDGHETTEKLIYSEVLQYKANYPDVTINFSPELATKDKKNAIVRLFFYSNYESVAYIDEKPITVILVLTATSKKEFERAFPSFQELVKSYSYLASEVEVKK